jgi:PAS domain S-box-containing protein
MLVLGLPAPSDVVRQGMRVQMKPRHYGVISGITAFCVLSFSFPTQAQSRRLRFDHLSVEDDLSNAWVQSILKDSRGFLWLGTQDGLNRYDGNSVKIYRHDPQDTGSLASSVVGALLEDSQKRLWVCSGWGDGGVALYDPEHDRFKTYWLRRGQSGANHVRSILEDRRGQLWLGTDNAVVLLDREGGDVKYYPLGSKRGMGAPATTVAALFEDSQNRMWVGTSKGLLRFDRARGKYTRWSAQYGALSKLAGADISDFYEESSGALWIATLGEGLFRVDVGKGHGMRYLPDPRDPRSINSARVRRIVAAGDDTLYIGTENGGLNILDMRTRTFTHEVADPEDEASLSSNSIWGMYLDNQGILWIGSYNGGVDYSLQQRFQRLRARRGGLSDAHVGSVMEDHQGNLWIGTDGGGLNRLNRRTGAFTYYRHDPKNAATIGSNAVFALLEDSSGMIWVGGWDSGLGRLDPASGRVTRFRHNPKDPESLVNDNVWRILELRSGELLVVTHGGVDLLDRRNDVFTHLSQRELAATEDTFFSAAEDGDGNLWIVGPSFVGYLDRQSGETKRYRNDPQDAMSLGTGWTQAILVDSVGNVWLGTEGGLSCVTAGTGEMRRYTTDDGLPNNTITSILEDRSGSLWVSTNRGLSKFVDATRLPGKPIFLNFDVHDGLQGHEFARNAACRGKSGEMFFGGSRGLNFFFPERIRQNPHAPPVVLTDLKIFNKSAGIGTPGSPLTKAITQTEALTLSYKHSMVTFEFTALNFILPQKNQYAYKLEGFDRDWNKVGVQRTATYTNLPYGSFTLRVRGSNNDGKWNDEGVSLKIRVTPPFWRAGWFYVVAFLVVAAAVVWGIRLRERASVARERELARKVEERTVELIEKTEALEHENEERRRAEESAGRERDLLHSLMDNIPDHIYFKDKDTRFTRVNLAHAKSLGLATAEEAIGNTDADFFPEEFARATRQDELELMQSGKPMLGKVEYEERTGRWFLATKVPIRDASGEIAGLVGISKDITDRRQAEERLTKELEAFQEVVSAVAEGDLTRRGVGGEDTLGRIALLVNQMLERISHILSEVRDAAFSVSTASSQILSASHQIAKGARHGQDQVHQTLSAVSEMAASMAEVSRSAEHSAEAARQVLERLQKSDRAVDDTAQGMTRIDLTVSATADKMRLLEKRSQEIFEIIDLIEEIASRSELLSMNAAIEAAHAGEAGRGFGVVADEIRHLAERSTEATRSVTAIVKGMGEETQAVLTAMESGMREIKQGLELSQQARTGLEEISLLVRQATELAGQISSAAREQTKATEMVAQAIETIANVTTESAAGAAETARAVQDLVNLSEQLNHTISRFKIDRPADARAGGEGREAALGAISEVAQQLGEVATQLAAIQRALDERAPTAPSGAHGDDGAAAWQAVPESPAHDRTDLNTLSVNLNLIAEKLARVLD